LREEGRLENYTTALEKIPLILGTIPIPTSPNLPPPPPPPKKHFENSPKNFYRFLKKSEKNSVKNFKTPPQKFITVLEKTEKKPPNKF